MIGIIISILIGVLIVDTLIVFKLCYEVGKLKEQLK